MGKKIDLKFFISCCYSYFINGMLVLMTGAILTYLMQDYHLSYHQAGLLVSIQATGSLISGLLSGMIIHKLGRKKTMLLVAITFTLGFGGIIFTGQPIILFFLIFLTGIGWGINNNLLNVLVSEASGGNSGYTNILHMGFAIGAFISPLMISTFIKHGISWKIAVGIVAMGSGLLFIVFLKLSLETLPVVKLKEEKLDRNLSFSFLKDPKYFVFMAILFSYVGVEMGLNSWLITYLVELGIMDITRAQLMLSLLWVIIIFGRIITAYLSKYIRKDWMLLGQCILMAVFYGLFLLNKNPMMAMVAIIAIGLSMAGIYPTTVANASYIVAGAGIGSGIMFAGGSLGATVVPYVAGALAGNEGIQAGMVSNFIMVIIMVSLATLNIILIRKNQTMKGA